MLLQAKVCIRYYYGTHLGVWLIFVGEGLIVLLSGPPGTGKTLLVEAGNIPSSTYTHYTILIDFHQWLIEPIGLFTTCKLKSLV